MPNHLIDAELLVTEWEYNNERLTKTPRIPETGRMCDHGVLDHGTGLDHRDSLLEADGRVDSGLAGVRDHQSRRDDDLRIVDRAD